MISEVETSLLGKVAVVDSLVTYCDVSVGCVYTVKLVSVLRGNDGDQIKIDSPLGKVLLFSREGDKKVVLEKSGFHYTVEILHIR